MMTSLNKADNQLKRTLLCRLQGQVDERGDKNTSISLMAVMIQQELRDELIHFCRLMTVLSWSSS